MSGVWKRSHGRTSEAPPDERGGNRYVRPTAAAPHLDSTLLRHPLTGKGWPLLAREPEARGLLNSANLRIHSLRIQRFQIATTRWVMSAPVGLLLLNHRSSKTNAAVRKTLRTGACSAGTFLLVGQLIGPGEPNATPAHPRDLIALAIAQIPCPVCLVGLRRAWLRIRCRTVTSSSLNVRTHRFLERHASLRVDEAAI